ncbi:hypothetical protein TPR58_01270 [Sphingomonas sp. HF-S3]|uniref:Uncharacterized protein n=1 Tax=Sphingomonas rustica TaxID=3103142 RepID=A0ABV0B2F4_9SPHN
MYRKLIFATALTITLMSPGARAQALEYDCDTQAEHYSVLKAVQDGPDYAASANISLREIFAVKKYVTLGMLEFEPEDGSWRARLGITALNAGKQTVIMGTLEITRGDKAEEPKILGDVFEFQKGKAYPIELTLGAGGGVAKLGDHSVPLDLKASGKVNVSVICSGGEFLFTDLKLGK